MQSKLDERVVDRWNTQATEPNTIHTKTKIKITKSNPINGIIVYCHSIETDETSDSYRCGWPKEVVIVGTLFSF